MSSRSSPLVSSILRQLRAQPSRSSAWRIPISRPSTLPLRSRSTILPIAARAAHSIPRPKPANQKTIKVQEPQPWTGDAPKSEGERPDIKNVAYYQLSFTCVPCGHRSHHNISRQGYHHGSTLITCPDCRNRHVISDHLKIFGSEEGTVEELLRAKGELVKRGTLGEDGDIEFWPEDQSPEQAEPSTGKPEN